MSVVKILGVDVHSIDKKGLIRQVAAWVGVDTPGKDTLRTITYVNAHCLNVAQSDAAYRATLNTVDLLYSDGIGVVWAGRVLRQAHLYKVTGRDWITDFCAYAAEQGWGIYILAGAPGIARQAADRLRARWPSLRILGTADGFFHEKSEAETIKEIAALRPQVVFVGMGVPMQEEWLRRMRAQIAAPVCWAVGALFDYVAGAEPPVPGWLDALALEWLWRLWIDPAGKWKRYLLGNPVFVARVIKQRIVER